MAEGMELKELDRAAMGRRIRQRREVLGMSREDLARRLDVTSKFIADLEYGDKGTSVKNLYRLKQILGLSVDYLMDGDRSDLTEEEPRRLLNENIMGSLSVCNVYECQLESEPRARLILSHLCSFESEPPKHRSSNDPDGRSPHSYLGHRI